jgi:DNA-binding FadR family transcriptional regulator
MNATLPVTRPIAAPVSLLVICSLVPRRLPSGPDGKWGLVQQDRDLFEADDGLRPVPGAGSRSPEAIADTIEQEIIAEGWPVGSVFATQVALEERFGVSRTILREATRILIERRVLAPRRGRGGGLVVTAPDPTTVTRSVALLLSYQHLSAAELEEIRRPLELLSARLAAERIDEAAAGRLAAVVEAEQADPYGVGKALRMPNLHLALAEASGNRALVLFAKVTIAVSRHGAARGPNVAGRRLIDEHARIAAAVVAGDPDLAEQRMAEHLRSLRDLGL